MLISDGGKGISIFPCSPKLIVSTISPSLPADNGTVLVTSVLETAWVDDASSVDDVDVDHCMVFVAPSFVDNFIVLEESSFVAVMPGSDWVGDKSADEL